MKTVYINASPKKRFCASAYFLFLQRLFVPGQKVTLKLRTPADHDRILQELDDAQNVVFSLPLYVDGIPSHVHSCGPEKELIRICHDETALTVIDPLEIPPMGDCDLKQIKRLYGDTLVLKGNLHTTNVMLRGTPEDVARASRQAIDDGAAGGRFILSTGDQCGRDTPDENIFAMIETARTYGRYA